MLLATTRDSFARAVSFEKTVVSGPWRPLLACPPSIHWLTFATGSLRVVAKIAAFGRERGLVWSTIYAHMNGSRLVGPFWVEGAQERSGEWAGRAEQHTHQCSIPEHMRFFFLVPREVGGIPVFDSRTHAFFFLVPRAVGGIAPDEADKIRTSDRVGTGGQNAHQC